MANGTRPHGSQVGFVIILIASTFLMGSSFVAGKTLISEGFPSLLLVGWRFFVAAMATLPLVAFERAKRPVLEKSGVIGIRQVGLVALIGLVQTAGVMSLLFLAMESISASTAAILLFTNPLWVAMLGRIFLREALPTARIVGLLLGIAGVALAIGIGPTGGSSPSALLGEAIGFASALCWSTGTIINKSAKLPIGPWTLSFWQMMIGALAILGIAYGLGQSWPEVTTYRQWCWFLWLAIPASTGSFGLWFVALEKGGATRTSGFLFLAPLFTVMLSVGVMGESMNWLRAVGGLLIGAAIWLISRGGDRAE